VWVVLYVGVFQASVNTLLSHFIGLVVSLWLLRSITDAGEQTEAAVEETA